MTQPNQLPNLENFSLIELQNLQTFIKNTLMGVEVDVNNNINIFGELFKEYYESIKTNELDLNNFLTKIESRLEQVKEDSGTELSNKDEKIMMQNIQNDFSLVNEVIKKREKEIEQKILANEGYLADEINLPSR